MPGSETRFAVLLFTDIVDSTELKGRHGVPAYSAALRTHNAHFERLAHECLNLRTLQSRGDGYFVQAGSITEAVRFALLFQEALRAEPWSEVRLTTRIGIHAGEVGALEAGDWIVGPAADLGARVADLAVGGQILLTRFPFDEARHFIREHPAVDGKSMPPLCWLAHGPYRMKGRDEPLEVFEVGAEDLAPLAAPPDGVKARRAIRPGEEETLGWRPAVGLRIPGRAGWHLTERLGAGGFGEVWIGEQAKLRQRRAFKFCFDDERLRALKREVTLVRLLRSALGERDDIVHIHELKLDAPPFYLESDLAPHGNLLQWAESQGGLDKIPLAQRIALVAHAATALAAAHSIGVLHKDIKPTNILIFDAPNGEPRPRFVDFGIGTLADPAVLGQHGVTAAGFTRATVKHSTGTPTYSPPEYLAGKPYTIQGDIYGLGVLLYQLVAVKPFDPLAQGWEREIPDPLLREDIAACVDGDPARRLPSATELANRLLRLDQRRTEIAEKECRDRVEAARAQRKQTRKIVARLLLLALLFIAVGWLGFEFLALIIPSRLNINANPPGIEVWQDDRKVGVTPFYKEQRKRGQFVYVLKSEAFKDLNWVGTLSPGRLVNMNAALQPPLATPILQDDHVSLGELTEMSGIVEFKQPDGWTLAPRGMRLRGGDVVRTNEVSWAQFVFRGGTWARLGERSQVKIVNDIPAIHIERGSVISSREKGVHFIPAISPPPSVTSPSDEIHLAELVEKENIVEYKRSEGAWAPASLGMKFQVGDKVRTRRFSRASIRFSNGRSLQLDAFTTMEFAKSPVTLLETPAANGVLRE